MRRNLKEARQKAGMTQKEVAEKLGITEQHYQRIEYGKVTGKTAMWDKLEDLFNCPQRILRENSNNLLDKEVHQVKHLG